MHGTRVNRIFSTSLLTGICFFGGLATAATWPHVVYPKSVSEIPQLKGVMLGSSTEKEFKDLRDMGATLVRYQMHGEWSQFTNSTDAIAAYNTWLGKQLDHLEEILPWARKYGIRVCVDQHTHLGGFTNEKYSSDMMYADRRFEELQVSIWKRIAKRFKGNWDVIYGYDLFNEPIDRENHLTRTNWRAVTCRTIEVIRAIDPDAVIVIEPNCNAGPHGFDIKNPYGLSGFSPLPYDNLIYSVHVYAPIAYTHQGLFQKKEAYRPQHYPSEDAELDPNRKRYAGDLGKDDGKKQVWNKDFVRREIQSVRDFQLKTGARIFVGEFSAAAYAPGADKYLSDLCELFDEYGWDWTYHAFRESNCWSLEHEGASFYELKPAMTKTPRMRVIERFLRQSDTRSEIVRPILGEAVSQVLPEQKAFFAKDRMSKLDAVMSKSGHAELEAMKQKNGRPQPVVVEWKTPVHGPYRILLKRADDGTLLDEKIEEGHTTSFDSLEVATDYFVEVQSVAGKTLAKSSFRAEDWTPRLLNVGPVNARDIGGRVGLGGRRIRQGLLFRSAGLNRNSTVCKDTSGAVTNFTVHSASMSEPAIRKLVEAYHIKTDLDLRNENETYGMKESPLGKSVRFVPISAGWYGGYFSSEKNRVAFKRCFEVLLEDGNYPVLFHCSGGADRTGSFAFVLEALLGCSQPEIDNDWLMTHFTVGWSEKPFTSKEHYLQLVEGLEQLPGATWADKAAAYCRSCGITDAQITWFREKMLGGDCASKVDETVSLEEGFAHPPEDAKLQVWWHWLTKSNTKEGVDADLKAMKEMEISTAYVFVPGFSGMPDKTGKILTPEWIDVFKYAIERASHYGIKLGFHNCPGWSASGGPWISPENSMQVLVSSVLDTELSKGGLKLPDPPQNGFYEDVATFAFPADDQIEVQKMSADFPGDVEGFRDGTAGLALPVKKPGEQGVVTIQYAKPISARFLSLDFDNRNLYAKLTVEGTKDGTTWKKIGSEDWQVYLSPKVTRYVALSELDAVRSIRLTFEYREAPGWGDHEVTLRSFALTSLPVIPRIETLNCSKEFGAYWPAKGEGLSRSDVHDVTVALGKDGVLAWKAPRPGRWRILRLGRTSTGKSNSPADVAGYECDKLSKRGLDQHWPHMPKVFAELPGARDAIVSCVIDSFEAGGQNWTKDMIAEFRRRRGYDMTPYLPVIAGYAVGTQDESRKFLEDFRRTVSDLFAENYYDYFSEKCHAEGWKSATEAYGGLYDSFRCWRKADVPTTEFWIEWAAKGVDRAASAAHFNGAKYAAAESFTSWPEKGRWQVTPRQLRECGDARWATGLNRFVVHSYLQQPLLNVVPGASLHHHGSQFNRNTTWWRDGVAWSRYVARSQFLLQSGRPQVDVLAFDMTGHLQKIQDAGYSYDTCSVDDFERLSNGPDGSVVTPSGMRYEMIFLGDRVHWPLRTLRAFRRLAEGGARIAGNCPQDTNSLGDDPAEWTRERDSFWRSGHANVKPCGLALPAVQFFGLKPSVGAHGLLRFVRRDVGDARVYYVANTSDADYYATTAFSADPGTSPELWDAADGSRRRLPVVKGGAADEARIALDLPAHQSAFVVFRPGKRMETGLDVPVETLKDGTIRSRTRPEGEIVADLTSGWRIVSFDGKCPPKAPISFPKLSSWSESDDLSLRYFSGRAVYEKRAVNPVGSDGRPRERLRLDLGDVRDVANVYVNGKFVKCLWCAPYAVDLPKELVSRPFDLRVEVVNCWPNRMIGDAVARKNGAAEPKRNGFPEWVLADRPDSGTGIYTWASWLAGWKAEDKPIPAGLLGPVLLRANSVK